MIGVQATRYKHEKGGSVFPPKSNEIPYRIMIPKKTENLIVASGKSVSTEPRGLIRGETPCLVLGQAAGAAAAVAARTGFTPRTVSIPQVQRELLMQNVFLGDGRRLAELGLG